MPMTIVGSVDSKTRSSSKCGDPPHIRALALIAQVGRFNPSTGIGATDALGVWLQEVFPGLGSVASQVGSFLVGNGLVTNPFYVNGVLAVTDLGRTVLELVRSAEAEQSPVDD